MSIKEAIKEMFFPAHLTCLVCGKELFENYAYDVCPGCQLTFIEHHCLKCGRVTGNLADYCDDCRSGARFFDQARAACLFEDGAKTLVYRFKYGGGRYLAVYLAQIMFDKLPKPAADIVTFVPLHKKRYKERGYNQARLLAARLAVKYDLPLCDTLIREVDTPHLTKLSREKRAQTMKSAIRADRPAAVNGKRVLLIDDVFTTGTTAGVCAEALKAAGAAAVTVYTFATAQIKPVLY